jgi:hypothetical protein
MVVKDYHLILPGKYLQNLHPNQIMT